MRPAGETDAAVLAEIQERASVAALGHIFPPERYPFPRELVLERWASAVEDPAASILVAEAEGDPVGAALVRREWLEGLYVIPACWGTGVAAELHDRGLEILRGLGSERCHLWVLEGNARARRFYERRGWRENGRTRVVEFPPNPLDVGYSLEFDR